MLRVQTACSAASSLLELFRARAAPPSPSRAAPVPHSAMRLHVVTPPCRISATSAAPQWAYPMAPNRADSHNGTALKLSLRAQKQKIGPCCNFFAIRDCYGSLQPQAGS